MAIEKEDIQFLENHFDDRYVMHDECNDKQAKINERLSNGDKSFAIINLKLSIMTWGIAIIASTAIAALIKEILSLVMKG